MSFKDKVILVLLSIITLGIYPLILFRKKNNKKTNKLSNAKKLKINLEDFYKSIGGKNNIVGSEYTHTKVRVFIKNRDKVNLDKINEIKGISGVVAASNYVTVIVGNQAKQFSQSL